MMTKLKRNRDSHLNGTTSYSLSLSLPLYWYFLLAIKVLMNTFLWNALFSSSICARAERLWTVAVASIAFLSVCSLSLYEQTQKRNTIMRGGGGSSNSLSSSSSVGLWRNSPRSCFDGHKRQNAAAHAVFSVSFSTCLLSSSKEMAERRFFLLYKTFKLSSPCVMWIGHHECRMPENVPIN